MMMIIIIIIIIIIITTTTTTIILPKIPGLSALLLQVLYEALLSRRLLRERYWSIRDEADLLRALDYHSHLTRARRMIQEVGGAGHHNPTGVRTSVV
jgi:uncharacterized protein YqgC (DUF456 family)